MPLRVRLGLGHPKVLEVITSMEENLEEPISCVDLAERCGVSTRQMERLFRKYLGRTPPALLPATSPAARPPALERKLAAGHGGRARLRFRVAVALRQVLPRAIQTGAQEHAPKWRGSLAHRTAGGRRIAWRIARRINGNAQAFHTLAAELRVNRNWRLAALPRYASVPVKAADTIGSNATQARGRNR